MTIPYSILERLKNNEITAKKFHEIEISILTILNFQDFIKKLLFEISPKFSVPYTWLSIIEESNISKYIQTIQTIQTSKFLRASTAFLSEKKFSSITRNQLKPLLANKNLNKFLAFHDPLTGLLNRGVMKSALEREFQRSKRYHIDLTVLFLDLDGLKYINDTYGHDNGDIALCHTANCLKRHRRDSDIVARFAGDEFVVILPSTNKSQAENYINRVKQKLASDPLSANNTTFYVK